MSPRAVHATSLLFGLFLGAACTGPGPSDLQPGGSGGKSDSTGDLACETAAPDDNGVCRSSDGRFAPAACCEALPEASEVECSFETPSFGLETSGELDSFVVSSTTVRFEDYEKLSPLERAQIRQAANHLAFLDGDETDAELFEFRVTDDEEYILQQLFIDGESPLSATWITFFAGDNEVGVLFAAGTLDIISEVSDGDLMSCSPVETPAEISCSFDELPVFGVDNSGELSDAVTATTTIERSDFDSLDDNTQAQLFAAATHLSFLDADPSVDDLFDRFTTDDEEFLYRELSADTATGSFAGEWVKFFAGDTEVGVVFEAGTTTIVAEVSDGDILSCN